MIRLYDRQHSELLLLVGALLDMAEKVKSPHTEKQVKGIEERLCTLLQINHVEKPLGNDRKD